MKKILLLAASLLCVTGSSRCAITVTLAGSNGNSTGSVFGSTMPAPASGSYNQAAGNCIYVGVNDNAAGDALSDTAGDTFTSIISYTGNNTDHINIWVAYNSAGNSANVVTNTVGGGGSRYISMVYYDVNVGGTCTSSLLDSGATGHTLSSGNVTTLTQSLTTATSSEVAITSYFCDSGTFTSVTTPTSYTGTGLITGSVGTAAYQVYSSTQSSTPVIWSNSPSTQTDVTIIAIKSAAASSVSRRRAMVLSR